MKDVWCNVFPKHLSFGNLKNLALSNKEYYNILKDYLTKRWEEKRLEICQLFPSEIIDMVGENNLMYRAEKIEWDMKYLGGTGYLDRIPLEIFQENNSSTNLTKMDICSSDPAKLNILYGLDCYERPFIFAKIKIVTLENTDYSVISIFQRYTKSSLYVSVEPQGKIYSFYEGQTSINDALCKKLTNVFHQGYTYDAPSSYYDQVEKIISLG